MLWYLLHPNWSIIRAAVGLWSFSGNRCFAVFEAKSLSNRNVDFLEVLKIQCAFNCWSIWIQKLLKEAVLNGLKFHKVFFNFLFMWLPGLQKFVHRGMKYLWWFILNRSVYFVHFSRNLVVKSNRCYVQFIFAVSMCFKFWSLLVRV